jgi:hypothetical protein
MPETYNPQERTFIKKPEQKCCSACGQPLPSDVKPFSNHFNKYIADSEGAVPCVINSNESVIVTADKVTLYKIDPKTGKANFPKPVAPTPSITPK